MISNRQLFLNHVAQTSAAPLMLEIERTEGVYMYDTAGKKYLDLIAGIGVSALGHSHPVVVNAVKEQAEKYMHLMVYGEFIESPQVKYAKRLTEFLPENLNNVYFTNSGAEATEGAMKLAKRITGRTQFVSFKNSYHGSTQGALSIMGDEYFKTAETNYSKAVELSTNNKEIQYNSLYNLGAMYNNYGGYLQNKKVEGKITDLQKLQKEQDAKSQEYYKKAIPLLEKALGIKNDDKATMVALRKLYLITGDEAKGKEMNEKIKGGK